MAEFTILYWQEIPSMVEAKDGSDTHKIQLSDGFQALIDQAAMVRGLAGTDGYLDEWNRGAAETREGPAEEVAKAVAEEFESRFQTIKATALKKD